MTTDPAGPTDEGWKRLDVLTLVTGPFKALGQLAVPAIAAIVGIGVNGGFANLLWSVPVAVVAVLVTGFLPYLTTSYRTTATHLEIRKGLLNKSTVTARLDRVRSVDLESPVLHRLLGITRVRIGTGVDDGQLMLDSLRLAEAQALQRSLLHAPGAEPASSIDGVVPVERPAAAPPIAVFDLSWIRFAPLNVTNLAIIAGAAAAILGQVSESVGEGAWHDVWDWVEGVGVLLVVVGVPLAVIVAWVPASCLGYLVKWWGLVVSREQGREGPTLRRAYGLLTTKVTTVEESKMRGAILRRPFLVNEFGGADLRLLTVGLADNTPGVLPAAPRRTVEAVAADLLGDGAPMTAPVTGHGPRTLRRYVSRAARRVMFAAILVAAATVALREGLDVEWPLWASLLVVLAAAAFQTLAAWLRFSRLGHALTERHLVSATGAFSPRRTVLETDGIVGWKIRQGFFDRRLGLAQLTATTAAGHEFVLVPDIELGQAVALAARADPVPMAEFVS